MVLALEETFSVGTDTFFSSVSQTETFGVVFEDDHTTGYFYALEMPSGKILDALHIYDVARVIDKEKPSKIQVFWTDDGCLGSLLINNYCHAIFDFESKAGYCRNGFPETPKIWRTIENRTLTDELIIEIFKTRK